MAQRRLQKVSNKTVQGGWEKARAVIKGYGPEDCVRVNATKRRPGLSCVGEQRKGEICLSSRAWELGDFERRVLP